MNKNIVVFNKSEISFFKYLKKYFPLWHLHFFHRKTAVVYYFQLEIEKLHDSRLWTPAHTHSLEAKNEKFLRSRLPKLLPQIFLTNKISDAAASINEASDQVPITPYMLFQFILLKLFICHLNWNVKRTKIKSYF